MSDADKKNESWIFHAMNSYCSILSNTMENKKGEEVQTI